MGKEDTSYREASSSSESEGHDEDAEEGMPEYERQRLARIKENQARLQALGVPQLASSLALASSSKRRLPVEKEEEEDGKGAKRKSKKNKKRVGLRGEDGDATDDDVEYQPSENEGNNEDEDDQEEEEENRKGKKISSAPRKKGNKRTPSKAVKALKNMNIDGKTRDYDFSDDNVALEQAIALSLGGEMEDSAPGRVHSNCGTDIAAGPCKEREKLKIQENVGKRKNKNVVKKSRVQLTEDEVVAYFFSFDEVGKGYITVRDLQKMAIAHDFCWTENEISSMIVSFDCNGDGKLRLEDFRTIVCRCNMLQELGYS